MEPILSVGRNKGEFDFAIVSEIKDLSEAEMNEFRAMIVVAIGIAEAAWRRADESRYFACEDGL